MIVRLIFFFTYLSRFNFPDVTNVQTAFIQYFFPLTHTLTAQLKDSKNNEDLNNFDDIIQKGKAILNFEIKVKKGGFLGLGETTEDIKIANVINENQKSIATAPGYYDFQEDIKIIDSKLGKVQPKNEEKNKNLMEFPEEKSKDLIKFD